MEITMTGREAYEEDCRRRPTYPDGTPRKTWEELADVERSSWDRDPTPREWRRDWR
jgi:hypothetical protein